MREREQSAEINYSTHGWRCRLMREREQSAEINYSTHRWRCRLKKENKVLRSTAVLKGGGVDS